MNGGFGTEGRERRWVMDFYYPGVVHFSFFTLGKRYLIHSCLENSNNAIFFCHTSAQKSQKPFSVNTSFPVNEAFPFTMTTHNEQRLRSFVYVGPRVGTWGPSVQRCSLTRTVQCSKTIQWKQTIQRYSGTAKRKKKYIIS